MNCFIGACVVIVQVWRRCTSVHSSKDEKMSLNQDTPQSSSQNVNQQEQNSSQATPTYAAATQKDQFPKKDQAIVIDSISDIPIDKYILEIGKLTSPNNIRFVSRISGNRVCVYLESKQTVTDIISKHSHIKINDNTLQVRPLITHYKRLILSNVCPVIPHYVLTDALEKLKIRTNSAMTFIKAGMSNPGYSHILSFRRQIYIHPEDEELIPESLHIKFDDTNYWIYLSTDTLKCFLCKQSGHIAKQCSQNTIPNTDQLDDLETTTAENGKTIDLPKPSPTKNKAHTETQRYKRTLSDTSSTKATDTMNEPNNDLPETHSNQTNLKENDNETSKNQKSEHKPKKSKSSNPQSENNETDQNTTIKGILNDPKNKYPLTYMQYQSLLDNTKGVKDITATALEYCNDLSSLTSMLSDLYPHLKTKSAKIQHTKMINKLKKFLDNLDAETTDEDRNSTCSESENKT